MPPRAKQFLGCAQTDFDKNQFVPVPADKIQFIRKPLRQLRAKYPHPGLFSQSAAASSRRAPFPAARSQKRALPRRLLFRQNAPERLPVHGARPKLAQGGKMFFGTIALMLGETIAGIAVVELIHKACHGTFL